MPRVHFVKKARKDNKKAGIKKGDSYYWWKTRMKGSASGVVHYSKARPRPSQLTMSPFYQQVYAAQESVEDAGNDISEITSALRVAAEEIRSAGEECDEKYNNMPEGLQQGETGQLLEARRDACETLADQLESVADDIENEVEGEDEDSDGKRDQDAENKTVDMIQEHLDGIDWTFE